MQENSFQSLLMKYITNISKLTNPWVKKTSILSLSLKSIIMETSVNTLSAMSNNSKYFTQMQHSVATYQTNSKIPNMYELLSSPQLTRSGEILYRKQDEKTEASLMLILSPNNSGFFFMLKVLFKKFLWGRKQAFITYTLWQQFYKVPLKSLVLISSNS